MIFDLASEISTSSQELIASNWEISMPMAFLQLDMIGVLHGLLIGHGIWIIDGFLVSCRRSATGVHVQAWDEVVLEMTLVGGRWMKVTRSWHE